MKLFRKIKYRLRRFIISLISVLCLCSVFLVSASADVLSPSGTGQTVTRIQPYYWNGTEWIYSDSFTFRPGVKVDTGFNVPIGNSFGMTYNVYGVNDGTYTDGNVFSVPVGILHFRISFDTNKYFTSPQIPYIDFRVAVIDEDNGGQVMYEHVSILPEDFTYNYSVTRYGNKNLWNVVTDIYLDSSVIPYSNFSAFYFYLQRDKSATDSPDTWQITCKEFICEVLTGADVPKYQKPDDTAKNELDSVEGALNDTVDSFGSGIGNIFNFNNFSGLVSGMNFWTSVISPLFSLEYIAPILSFSLAVGIFSLLFGLFSSLAGRSSKRPKPKKQKGG